MSFRTILVPTEQHDLMSSTLETAPVWRGSLTVTSKGSLCTLQNPAAYAMADPTAVTDQFGARFCRKCETNPRLLRELHAKAWCAVWGSHSSPVKQLAGRCP